MTIPVITFFNNKDGVGRTSLVYHLAWMLSDLGHRVLACDLDPQANLTTAFLNEGHLEKLWDESEASPKSGVTIFECVKPLMQVGDLKPPRLQPILAHPSLFQGDIGTNDLRLIPGDLALTEFEDTLYAEWQNALESSNLYSPFRVLTAFSTIMQAGASTMKASIILADVGPNLGAINRSALIASDYVVVPLGADLFSLRGLRNLGPTLNRWRRDWQSRRKNWATPEFALPKGEMKPTGYIMQQHALRLNRPVIAYDKWVNRMPAEYARNLLDDKEGPYPDTPSQDEKHALATVKHYRSLVPMAQEARKPIFHLTPADGAIGSHAAAARDAYTDFKILAEKIAARINLPQPSP